MSHPLLSMADPSAVGRCVDALDAGALVVVPTDTVYGVAALPTLPGATGGLFRAKGRGADVPLALLCAQAADALALADLTDPSIERRARDWAAEHWPGPLTMVLPRRGDLGWELGEPRTTVGVRVPDHDFVRALAARVGPLAVTSANRHGDPTPFDAPSAAASLGDAVELTVDGGHLDALASTVVDVATGTVFRQGAVHVVVAEP